jgi:hypothetical protein
MDKAGLLPPSLRLGGRTLWRLDLIEQWIEEQTQAQVRHPSARRATPRNGGRRKVATVEVQS